MKKKRTRKSGTTPGCERCRAVPSNAREVALVPIRAVWESSHSSFKLTRCESCGQRYLKQFHEIIDWGGGEDDVWIRWMPLTDEEEAGLDAISGSWNQLAALMRRRARLVMHPDGEFRWGSHPDAGDLMPPG
jgi:hypothetical protein